MILQQLRTADVSDPRILSLYDSIPRHHFTPPTYETCAYSDMHIPIGCEQYMLSPMEEGRILQALNIQLHERVLEIGSGSGFFSALLSHLSQEVVSIEYYTVLTQYAQKKCREHRCTNVTFINTDGIHGYPSKGPYDVIIYTGSTASFPHGIQPQLSAQGRLITFIGAYPVVQVAIHTLSKERTWSHRVLFETYVPALMTPKSPCPFVLSNVCRFF